MSRDPERERARLNSTRSAESPPGDSARDPDSACLYLLLETPREKIEEQVASLVTPLAGALRDDPALDSLFFVRASEPGWELRIRILGEPGWIAGRARAEVDAALARIGNPPVRRSRYERELERYGGPAGMRSCERLFHCDTLAVLDWLALERAGATSWTRREFALLLAERVADGFAFGREERAEFYRQGFSWAFATGLWDDHARDRLAQAYARNREGLAALVRGAEAKAGSAAERACLADYARAARPAFERLTAGLADGEVTAHPPFLAWSLAHMATNRLGLDPAAEAILRDQAFRLFAET